MNLKYISSTFYIFKSFRSIEFHRIYMDYQRWLGLPTLFNIFVFGYNDLIIDWK